MKKNSLLSLLAILVFLMASAGNASAQWGTGRMQASPERDGVIYGIPDLTDEQLDQIKDLYTKHLKDVQPLKNDVKINNARLQAMMTGDEPDMNQISDLIGENGKILTELRKKQVAHRLEIRSLLTDDQKVYFDNRMHRLRGAFHGRMNAYRMAPHQGRGYHRGNW